MSESNTANASVEVPAPGSAGEHTPNPMRPETEMVVLTWIAFGIMAAILYKVAWKPILAALEAREARIRQALEDADQARDALTQIEGKRAAMRAETEAECKAVIAKAREAATVAATQVEQAASERMRVQYENAERDIESMKRRVIAEIRREQADLIVKVSERLIAQNLDAERNRVLVDKLIGEL